MRRGELADLLAERKSSCRKVTRTVNLAAYSATAVCVGALCFMSGMAPSDIQFYALPIFAHGLFQDMLVCEMTDAVVDMAEVPRI